MLHEEDAKGTVKSHFQKQLEGMGIKVEVQPDGSFIAEGHRLDATLAQGTATQQAINALLVRNRITRHK